MAKKIADTLLELCDADRELAIVLAKKDDFEKVRNTSLTELDGYKTKIAAFEAQLQERAVKQAEDANRLQEEQAKIIERRKALTDLGGAKSAKLVEREIDIASRSLQILEERAVRSLDDVEQVRESIDSLKEELVELERDFSASDQDRTQEIENLDKETTTLEKKREKLLTALNPSLQEAYTKVARRYPATVVAVAAKHSCQVCHRHLPDQLYNTLQGDSYVLSCPGCSRILVYKD